MEHPDGALVMSQNVYGQMQVLENNKWVIYFASYFLPQKKTTHKYVYTPNLLIFYIYTFTDKCL